MEETDLYEDELGRRRLADAAARAEGERLRAVNGNPLTHGAYRALHEQGAKRGVQNYMGVEDRRFLSKAAHNDRLPAAQFSGNELSLQRAIEMGVVSTVTEFLTRDAARLNSVRNAHGETLLHSAVLHEHVEIVQLLLRHGADPTLELPDNGVSQSTLESVAPRTVNYKYSRMLHAAEATVVHYACGVGNMEILKLLLAAASRYKLSPPFQVRRAGSLLVWAITAGHAAVVEYLLLKKKLEADCFDEDGNNSFGVAALALGNPDHENVLKAILKLLARCDGIEINHKNMNGLTAFDTAEEPHVKLLLQQFGGRSARVLDMERLLRWDRDRSRDEYTYRRERLGAIKLRPSSEAA